MAEAARRTRPSGTWWCWVTECPNHAGREVPGGIPPGWIHLQVGLGAGRGAAFLTFCGVPCLKRALQRSPRSFLVVEPGRRAAGGAGS